MLHKNKWHAKKLNWIIMGHANQCNYAIFDPLIGVLMASVSISPKIKQMTLKTNQPFIVMLRFEEA